MIPRGKPLKRSKMGQGKRKPKGLRKHIRFQKALARRPQEFKRRIVPVAKPAKADRRQEFKKAGRIAQKSRKEQLEGLNHIQLYLEARAKGLLDLKENQLLVLSRIEDSPIFRKQIIEDILGSEEP